MDVLEGRIPGHLPGLDVRSQSFEPAHERLDFVWFEQPGPAQSVDVSDRAGDVVDGQDVVEID